MAELRSLDANAYYHAVVKPSIADSLGISLIDAHRWIKKHFKIKSTASLSTIKFEELMSDIRLYSLNTFGVEIQLPNENL